MHRSQGMPSPAWLECSTLTWQLTPLQLTPLQLQAPTKRLPGI